MHTKRPPSKNATFHFSPATAPSLHMQMQLHIQQNSKNQPKLHTTPKVWVQQWTQFSAPISTSLFHRTTTRQAGIDQSLQSRSIIFLHRQALDNLPSEWLSIKLVGDWHWFLPLVRQWLHRHHFSSADTLRQLRIKRLIMSQPKD